MRRIVAAVIAGAVTLGVFTPAAAANAVPSDIRVYAGGTRVNAPVRVIDGRAYLPVRAIGEALGYPVGWSGAARVVHFGAAPQVLEGNDLRLAVDGAIVPVALEIIEDRAYAPVRALAGALGMDAVWSDVYRTVVLVPASERGKSVQVIARSDVDAGWIGEIRGQVEKAQAEVADTLGITPPPIRLAAALGETDPQSFLIPPGVKLPSRMYVRWAFKNAIDSLAHGKAPEWFLDGTAGVLAYERMDAETERFRSRIRELARRQAPSAPELPATGHESFSYPLPYMNEVAVRIVLSRMGGEEWFVAWLKRGAPRLSIDATGLHEAVLAEISK